MGKVVRIVFYLLVINILISRDAWAGDANVHSIDLSVPGNHATQMMTGNSDDVDEYTVKRGSNASGKEAVLNDVGARRHSIRC